MKLVLQLVQGTFIGVGAVLPGVSGGVLCVIFGIYKVLLEFLAEPFKNMKTHLPILIPYGTGAMLGFMGIANMLSVLLEKYPAPSVCVFIGLIAGMLPALFREAGERGRTKKSYMSMSIAMIIILGLLLSLKVYSVTLKAGFGWYLFSGFCLALSVIVPGLSFSTLLMPLGLYEPLVTGIGKLDFSVLFPSGIGAVITFIVFTKIIKMLFEKHYSIAFHAIIGVVLAATIMIIPIESFSSLKMTVVNILCLGAGIGSAIILERVQRKKL